MNLVDRLRKEIAENDAGLPVECFVDFDDVQKLLTAIETLMGAMEYVVCESMDDVDFYTEEDIKEGTVPMASRPLRVLLRVKEILR